jgi:uncharacterized protein YbaR (Trm112 family)
MNLDWINDFLPTMRCPDTHQSLRWATAEDLARHAFPPEAKALAREDGSRLFPIDQGIPILLPEP